MENEEMIDTNLQSQIWRAIIEQDEEQLKESSKKLGAGDMYQIFPLILAGWMSGSKSSLGERLKPEDRQKLRDQFGSLTFSDVMDIFEGVREFYVPKHTNTNTNTKPQNKQLPRDLLLVLRTNNLVRSINRDLGGTSLSRFKLFGDHALRGIFTSEAKARALTTRNENWMTLLSERFRYYRSLFVMNVGVWFIRIMSFFGKSPKQLG